MITVEKLELFEIDLSKQQKLHADLKTIQQINFTGNLELDGNATTFFNVLSLLIEEAREAVFDFSIEP